MLDPSGILTVDPDVAADVAARGAPGPVLVHAIRGFVDAGHVGDVVAQHLLGQLTTRRLATFDVDQLLDYRSRRPTMTFEAGTWREYDEPTLAVELATDTRGVSFLLLHGWEPDVQWERYVAAVRGLVERFRVPLTVGVHGVPTGVPHTRPITSTTHATRPELVGEAPSWFATVRVPASAQTLLELRLGQAGHDAMGFVVHVPHYLAASTYPQAAVAALHRVAQATGLELAVAALDGQCEQAARQIEEQVAASAEVSSLVRTLEEQYDAFLRGIGRAGLLGAADLPTADELGAQFERFLAEQRPDEG